MRKIIAFMLAVLLSIASLSMAAVAEAQATPDPAAANETVVADETTTPDATAAPAKSESAAATKKATPLSKGLQWLIFGLVVAVIVIVSVVCKKKFTAVEIAIIGIMASIAYVAYAFLKIPITTGGSTSSIHVGNMVPALTALLLDGASGGLAGAIGLTMADILSGQPHYAITTFILKFMIGFICGTVAHKAFKLEKRSFNPGKLSRKQALSNFAALIVSAASGLVFNIVADPFLGYFRKIYIQGLSEDISKSLAKISSAVTAINAGICLVLCVMLYLAISPALKKSGILNKRVPAKERK